MNKMAKVSPLLSILTLNVNGLNSPMEDMQCLNGLVNKNQQYALYKRLTLDVRTHRQKAKQ